MSTKWKLGTKVVPTKECITWYREHLFECNNVCGKIPRDRDAYEDGLLLWATADLSRPRGRVIPGNPADADCVKVKFKNKFGSYEGYMEKDSLLKKK